MTSNKGNRRLGQHATFRDFYQCYLAAIFLSGWSLVVCFSGLPLKFFLAPLSLMVALSRFFDSMTFDSNFVVIQSFSFFRGLNRIKIERHQISHFDVFPKEFPNSKLSIYAVLKTGKKIRTPIRISMNQYTHIPPPDLTHSIPAIKKLNDLLEDIGS